MKKNNKVKNNLMGACGQSPLCNEKIEPNMDSIRDEEQVNKEEEQKENIINLNKKSNEINKSIANNKSLRNRQRLNTDLPLERKFSNQMQPMKRFNKLLSIAEDEGEEKEKDKILENIENGNNNNNEDMIKITRKYSEKLRENKIHLTNKKVEKKFSDKYCNEFKRKYSDKDKRKNSLIYHLANTLSKGEKFSEEQINELKEKFLPKYLIDWKFEEDKNDNDTKKWNNHGKVQITKEIYQSFEKTINKYIGASEPFYKKRIWLIQFILQNMIKTSLAKNNEIVNDNPILYIDKSNLFEDSFKQIMINKELDYNKFFKIRFNNEEKENNEFTYKEWLENLFKIAISEEKKLFRRDFKAYRLDKDSLFLYPYYEGMNLEHYEFIGKLLTKYFMDLTNSNFFRLNRTIIKKLMNRPIVLDDLKYYDLEIYKSLLKIKNTVIKDNKELEDIKFTWNVKYGNNITKEEELVPNGKNINLSDDNKNQFIDKVIYYETTKPYEQQFNSLRKGLLSSLKFDIFSSFSIEEMDFLFAGQQAIDLNDWKENTLYVGNLNKDDDVIKFFWNKLERLENFQLNKFLEFSTGFPNAPIDGFNSLRGTSGKIQQFTIEPYINYMVDEEEQEKFRIIESKPCFNRICIPKYKTQQDMDKAIDIILENNFNLFDTE